MAQEENIESNKAIADFMCWQHHEDAEYDKYEMSTLKYHSSWDWLMPVVEKIERIELNGPFKFYVDPWYVDFLNIREPDNWQRTVAIERSKYDTLKAAIQAATVAFIKWYNKQEIGYE